MSGALLNALRARGVDVLTTEEAERRGSTDQHQLAFATEEARVIVTRNAGHFAALHARCLAEGRTHAGIVILPRQRRSSGAYADAFDRLSGQLTAEDMANRLEFLGNWM